MICLPERGIGQGCCDRETLAKPAAGERVTTGGQMRQYRSFVTPDRMVATGTERMPEEQPEEPPRSLVIGRALLVGFGAATVPGIYLGLNFGWAIGVVAGWMGGNVLALTFAYAWFRVDLARQARAAHRARAADSESTDSREDFNRPA